MKRLNDDKHAAALQKLQVRMARYTQANAAREAGCSRQHLCDVLAGRRRMQPALRRWLGYKW